MKIEIPKEDLVILLSLFMKQYVESVKAYRGLEEDTAGMSDTITMQAGKIRSLKNQLGRAESKLKKARTLTERKKK